VVLIAACWTRVFVLDSGKRALERDPYHRLKSPLLVLGIVLGPQRFLCQALNWTGGTCAIPWMRKERRVDSIEVASTARSPFGVSGHSSTSFVASTALEGALKERQGLPSLQRCSFLSSPPCRRLFRERLPPTPSDLNLLTRFKVIADLPPVPPDITHTGLLYREYRS